MVKLEKLTRRLLLVGTGMRSVAMFVLLFGVLLLRVVQGSVALDPLRVFDPRLLLIVLPGFAAFAGIWLRRRWGAALAVASCLLDLFWWGWLAAYTTRRYGDITPYATEYAFFSVFYGAMIVLAVLEYKRLSPARYNLKIGEGETSGKDIFTPSIS
jgi:hypothetical protein